MTLYVRANYTNETDGHHIGEDPWCESFTDDRKRLFRFCQKEYGRCVSSVYVDAHDGPRKVGWYFERREEYQDSRPRYNEWGVKQEPETYIRGVWITPHDTEEGTANE